MIKDIKLMRSGIYALDKKLRLQFNREIRGNFNVGDDIVRKIDRKLFYMRADDIQKMLK